MLMKLISCSGDFEKTLKLRRLVALALLCVGLVGFACYFFWSPAAPFLTSPRDFIWGRQAVSPPER